MLALYLGLPRASGVPLQGVSSMPVNELKTERLKILNSIFFPALFVGLLWLIYFSCYVFRLSAVWFGLFPRTYRGIYGILTFHLVHGSMGHIFSNSVPLFFMGSIIFYFYRGIAFQVFGWVYLMTGVWLWAAGRNDTCHIGASGLVYGFVSFLFFSGIFRWDRTLLVLSLLVAFLYGSLVWGLLPLDPSISWEGHLMGALAGMITAWFYRKEGPKKKEYIWEDENENIIEEQAEDGGELKI